MGIKQKFIMLAGIVGVILIVVSATGYFTAYDNLSESVNGEIMANVSTERETVDGWLKDKARSVTAQADLMTDVEKSGLEFDNEDLRYFLSVASSDKDMQEMTRGDENGMFLPYYSPDETGKTDPRKRPWYSQARDAGKTVYTEVYTSKSTGDLVVSAVAPFYGENKQFRGAICGDITLTVLKDQVQRIKYRDQGIGYIIEKTGKLLATSGKEQPMSEAKDIKGVGEKLDSMFQSGSGYFTYDDADGVNQLCAYTTVPTTGWLIAMAVPTDFVFAPIHRMRMIYGVLIVIGFLLVAGICLTFAARITKPIVALEGQAAQLAEGNLRVDKLPITTSDEIGSMTNAFNKMQQNLHDLIGKMAATSEQVAAASEELTANAQQSADAAVHVAETIGEVSAGMEKQLVDIDGAKKNVDLVFNDITAMTEKTKKVSEASVNTSDAAKQGELLMQEATNKMAHIETSVMNSADVVRTLGESSQQIGQIVEAISSIADQTNLLALNAAIEAARAGEHGRGFAVVADEVRKLAAESQESAEQIKERILTIQKDTAHAVAAMEEGKTEVELGAKAIKDVGEQFQDIMGQVNGIKTQIDEITSSVNSVSSGAGNIVEAVDSIDSVSRKTADHTSSISAATEEQSASNEEIAAASQSLAHLASDMQAAINKFKL
ncbi:methyl-accepting chemotaxis protein [Selenomonas ruminantium]|uniref:Methyl-accepting chemotaxis sensory transducer with Cache sensor n=1 Tax=Selenomonas ruminantium TaxID=971 RepID=A0A1I0W9Z2_SELRU|nr:methyl-accepting chemotaxis protein [Selenomonas ruminantium]SFA85098.1 methyl-accepting chemotaxis sensory transducer with Cache sensor [Selenomonas ruminantium]